jgi:DNA invertase Pin-like site-specific DNA recombinase
MTIGVMAVVAQHEREAISARTKAALAAAKKRGTVLGGHREGSPDIARHTAKAAAKRAEQADKRVAVVAEYLDNLRGLSLNEMARRLNAMDVRAPRGGQWSAITVSRALKRLASYSPAEP